MRLLHQLPKHDIYATGVEGVSLFDRLYVYWRRPVQVWWRNHKLIGRSW